MSGLENFKKDFQGKRVLVLGLGVLGGGVKLVRFLDSVGCEILVSDLKTEEELGAVSDKLVDLDIEYHLGDHSLEILENVEVIIRNPAVPRTHQILISAKEKNIPIYMEAALFAKYSQSKIIGITGTRGKTTTSLLTHHIIETSTKKKYMLAGNIPGTCALSLLEFEEKNQILGTVLELSSWQLQGFDDLKISPHISILTNIYPDHLNRYDSIDDYIADKEVITKYQNEKNHLIFNGSNELAKSIAVKSSAQIIDFTKRKILDKTKINLIGDHNLQNIKAAAEACGLVGLSNEEVKEGVESFYPVQFRLEEVGIKDGVKYINDSTSTTPAALYAALNAVKSPVILIMGGNTKNLPWDKAIIITLREENLIKEIILLPGSGSNEIADKINHVSVESLQKAVEYAKDIARDGDTVLLSPGFTSFSQFKNEFDRGQAFNRIVENL